jgi:hypothetical protein
MVTTDLLAAILAELQAINGKLGQPSATENRDSVEITTSARGYDIKAKVYADTVAEAGIFARKEWLKCRSELERQLMGEKAS